MFPLSTKGGGLCNTTGPIDVCKVPAPPAPPIPTPFPNFGRPSDAKASTCPKKIKVENQPPLCLNSEIAMSHGDEPGVLKGVVSSTVGDIITYSTGSSKVKFEGNAVVMHLKTTRHNKNNAPSGMQSAPSQTKVIIGG
jgi:hypothetical protein